MKRYITQRARKDRSGPNRHDERVFNSLKGTFMRTWIKRSLFGLFGVSLLAGGMAACGHRHAGHGLTQISAEDAAKWRERAIERAADKLQLDAAQQQQLGALFDALREQRNALVGGSADPRVELQALVATERFDKVRAQAWIDEKTAALRARSPEVISAMAAFYDGLDPAQQHKLREFISHRGRHGRWRS
jgi:Spy/CpxP family protein refolding chaperone